ncbi:hypothetical protein TeGR_g1919 [Tetraparma gracilis]|uniref:Uncharacterized protein n=1 Tax=Tetraparma gracilis TaxID=2962635 RepID=A0ABQ6N4P5_9STRA|nr:hypothetical protein TeGR_g1919 [Tetraparma gracilis]
MPETAPDRNAADGDESLSDENDGDSVLCYCFKCDTEWTCDVDGGDWGENEEWVCERCLPECRACGKKLFQRDDACCGSGRTDDDV